MGFTGIDSFTYTWKDNFTGYVENDTCKINVYQVPITFSVTNTNRISATANELFQGQIATFQSSLVFDRAQDRYNLSAEISWGDGQTSIGSLNYLGSGSYSVSGTNTYAEGGSFPITVTLLNNRTNVDGNSINVNGSTNGEQLIVNGDPNGFQIDNTATVADAGKLAVYQGTSSPPTTTVPIIGDSGFESVSASSGFVVAPTGSAWTFSSGSGLSGNNSPLTSGNPNAPEGQQVAFIQNTGTIGQSIANWAAGNYRLSFQAAQRGNYGGTQTLQVLVDGAAVGTVMPSGTSYGTYTTSTFAVAAGTHTIAFVGQAPASGDSTAFIDAVSVAIATPVPPVVADSGFEAPAAGTGYYGFVVSPQGTPWTYSNGGAGVTANGTGQTSGNPNAPEGQQVAFIQNTGSITQSIANWSAGNYQISFQAAQRGNYGGTQTLQVLVDGAAVGTVMPSGTSYGTYTTSTFAVAAGTHTIAFVGQAPDSGDNTAFLDAVSVAVASSTTNVALGGTASDSGQGNAANGEGAAQAFDGNSATKWLTFATSGYLQVQLANKAPATVTSYQMTSGGDTGTFTGRAPKNWQLLGSNDGSTWAVLDTQTNQADTTSVDTRTYTVATPGSYSIYRLNITANNGDPNYTQLADLKLLGSLAATGGGGGVAATYPGDSGFESVSAGSGFVVNPSGSAWTFSSSSGVTGNNSPFTSGNPNAPEGQQVAFIQNTGTIGQTISNSTDGLYTLSLQAAQRANYGTAQSFQVLLDGTIVGTFGNLSATYQALTTSAFHLSVGSHVILFQGLNASGDATALLDAISIMATSSATGTGGVSASDAAPFDGIVARFTDSDPNATPDKYTTSIDFGDGEGPVDGYVVADPTINGVFDVYGDHDFSTAGTDSGMATITESGGTTLAMNFMTSVAEANSVAAAGSLPTIKITSRGSHPGDGTTTPTDVEGQQYTVGQQISMPAGNLTNSTKYDFVGFNYAYPSTAVKGYGRFTTTKNGTVRFVGDPDSAINTTVQYLDKFTVGDQSQSIYFGGNSNFVDSFYWGPTAQGTQTIAVTALFNVYINNKLQPQQYSATDSVQISVIKPVGANFNIREFGQPGIGLPGYSGPADARIGNGSIYGSSWLGFDKNTQINLNNNGVPVVTNQITGITYIARVDPENLNNLDLALSGRTVVTQTVAVNSIRMYTINGATVTQQFALLPNGDNPTVLDTQFSYNVKGPVSVGSTIQNSDSPGGPLRSPGTSVSKSTTDSFMTSLLYQPPRGIYVPVAYIKWGFTANATYDATAPSNWKPGITSRTPPTDNPVTIQSSTNADFPTWTHNFTEFNWVTK